MATEPKSNGNPFEEDEFELKEVIRKDFQEPSSSKVDPAADQAGASTSRPINEDMTENKDGRKDVKPEDEKAQDDKAKGDKAKDGESSGDKAQNNKANVCETRGDEGMGAKGKGDKGKGDKGKGAKGKDDKSSHDKMQDDTAQDMTDAIPPPNVETGRENENSTHSTEGATQDTSKNDKEGCGMKCLMYAVECSECVIS